MIRRADGPNGGVAEGVTRLGGDGTRGNKAEGEVAVVEEANVEVQVRRGRAMRRHAAGSGDGANIRHIGSRTRTASKWVLAAGLFTIVVPLTGCGNACTAIGWVDELEIEVIGPGSAVVERLEVCFDGSCYSGGGTDTPGQESPVVNVNAVSVVKFETGWKVTTSMQIPETVQLRASSETGQVLASQEAELDWKRVGGTARCGGPHEAKATLTLTP